LRHGIETRGRFESSQREAQLGKLLAKGKLREVREPATLRDPKPKRKRGNLFCPRKTGSAAGAAGPGPEPCLGAFNGFVQVRVPAGRVQLEERRPGEAPRGEEQRRGSGPRGGHRRAVQGRSGPAHRLDRPGSPPLDHQQPAEDRRAEGGDDLPVPGPFEGGSG
jgi:hypothetical protein